MVKDYRIAKRSFTEEFCREVYAIVCEIPEGRVLTYGGIAELMGMPQCSRMVGRALKEVPTDLLVPCHRVVNASGRLVPGWEVQKALLLAEGVSLGSNGCVNLEKYLWKYDTLQ